MTFCSSRTAMMHNFGDHRLRTHGDRRFIETSATIDYARMENASFIAAIMLAFLKNGDDAYLRRPPTTHAWRAPLYRPAIILAFHVSSSTLSTTNLSRNRLLMFLLEIISSHTGLAR